MTRKELHDRIAVLEAENQSLWEIVTLLRIHWSDRVEIPLDFLHYRVGLLLQRYNRGGPVFTPPKGTAQVITLHGKPVKA